MRRLSPGSNRLSAFFFSTSIGRLYRRSSLNIVATTHSFASLSRRRRRRRRSREDLRRTGTQPSVYHRTACSYSKTLYGMRVNRWRANHRLSMVVALKNLVNCRCKLIDISTRRDETRERDLRVTAHASWLVIGSITMPLTIFS